jgi:hypothetical protein
MVGILININRRYHPELNTQVKTIGRENNAKA